MKRFDGKVALITGSSNGIGQATAILFASEGAKVTITGRDAKALEVTETECLSKGAKAEDILKLLGDITTEDIQTRLVEETMKKFGRIDILINNHGGSPPEQDSEGNQDLNAFDAVMNLNCKSTLAMSLKALPHLKNSKGCIVNVSSIASTLATVPNPYYAMSKASLDHLTRILAIQNAKHGVRVNCVNPGLVRTKFMTKMGVSDEAQDQMVEVMKRTLIPCGRAGMPDDVAELIAFLSDNRAAGYIVGQTILIDGGTSLLHASGDCKEMDALMQKMKAT